MIWDSYQQSQIRRVNIAADEAKTKVEKYGARIEEALEQFERLSLACQAMWELLRDHTHLTEEDLASKMTEVDARDGRLDQKMGVQQVACPECGRPSNTKRSSCVFCGARIESKHQFHK